MRLFYQIRPHRSLIFSCACLLGIAWFVVEILPWHLGDAPLTPQVAFRKVMGQPMPADVSGLVIVQRQYVIKSWKWMRFRASDRTINSLVQPGRRIDDPQLMKWAMQGSMGIGNHRYDVMDKRLIGWPNVMRISKPEVYLLSSYALSDGYGWVSDVIVDRKNHLVYVLAAID